MQDREWERKTFSIATYHLPLTASVKLHTTNVNLVISVHTTLSSYIHNTICINGSKYVMLSLCWLYKIYFWLVLLLQYVFNSFTHFIVLVYLFVHFVLSMRYMFIYWVEQFSLSLSCSLVHHSSPPLLIWWTTVSH